MRWARIAGPLFLTCACLAAGVGQAAAPEYKGPSCVGDFCFSKSPLPSEKRLVSEHGDGLHLGESRCYAVPEQGAYVHFDVEHDLPSRIVTLVVSDVPSCEGLNGRGIPTSAFPAFRTREGVELGDSKEKVVKIYGPPTSTRPGTDAMMSIIPYSSKRTGTPFGETALVYDGPELLQSKFFLRGDKVAAIYISCSE